MTAAIITLHFTFINLVVAFIPSELQMRNTASNLSLKPRLFAVHNAKFQVLARLEYKLQQMQKIKRERTRFCVCVIKIIDFFVTVSVLQKRLFLAVFTK